MTERAPELVSYTEYLELERQSSVRHEYLRGQIFAMAGGTPQHAALAMAFGAQLTLALRGKPCRVFGSDLRVRVDATDLATYPDVAVVCGQFQASGVDPNAAANPTLIVEVLSDATEAYDRGEKFAHYRQLSSLREYVLVSQRRPFIELYRRDAAGRWVLFEAGPGEQLELTSPHGVRIDVDEIYRNPLVN